jgi:hypothetical protein
MREGRQGRKIIARRSRKEDQGCRERKKEDEGGKGGKEHRNTGRKMKERRKEGTYSKSMTVSWWSAISCTVRTIYSTIGAGSVRNISTEISLLTEYFVLKCPY